MCRQVLKGKLMISEDTKSLIKKLVKVFYIPVIILVFWGGWSDIASVIPRH